MTLKEALRKADEAEKEMYCGQWPQAVITLAKEVKKIQRKLNKQDVLLYVCSQCGLTIKEKSDE